MVKQSKFHFLSFSSRNFRADCTGFTLIEVLIAMLILAIGALGVAALQFKGLQYNQDSYFRTQISILAYDMAERMRLNRANANTYATSLSKWEVPVKRPAACEQTGTKAVGVANDLLCWKSQLYTALPPGSIADISKDGSNETYTITLTWTDREDLKHEIKYTFKP